MPDDTDQNDAKSKYVTRTVAFRPEQAKVIEDYCKAHGITRADGTPEIPKFIRMALVEFFQEKEIDYPEMPFEFGGKREGAGRKPKKRRRSHATDDTPPSGSTIA